ncbi:MAG: Bax inhibitor-1/YccA family membrane protein, partial [Planctomycetota bacterium]
ALIGLGINVFILGVASMWLIIDFKLIEDRVAEGGPKYMEWYCGFALLVTLAWIYFEAVKLAFRIAILLGNRD